MSGATVDTETRATQTEGLIAALRAACHTGCVREQAFAERVTRRRLADPRRGTPWRTVVVHRDQQRSEQHQPPGAVALGDGRGATGPPTPRRTSRGRHRSRTRGRHRNDAR
ncbi:MAG: hypothetical protein M3291_07170 [Actinomycetota bacterium]|nr:hypothetical protein [Actinomycetota bacterium]